MNKNLILLLTLCALTLVCSGFTPIKQITIPLDTPDGVPCFISTDERDEDIYIDGFAVDSEENAYFAGVTTRKRRSSATPCETTARSIKNLCPVSRLMHLHP